MPNQNNVNGSYSAQPIEDIAEKLGIAVASARKIYAFRRRRDEALSEVADLFHE